jgi:hypothetical protein
MGMFGTLMGKIFRSGANADAADAAPVQRAPNMAQREATREAAGGGVGAGLGVPTPGITGGAAMSGIDVEANLDRMAASHGEKLDWKHSIVDMLKLVGMDSSLAARKELAEDLNYTGDTNDSATMNMWLHKEVLKKLAENGGRIPPSLLNH